MFAPTVCYVDAILLCTTLMSFDELNKLHAGVANFGAVLGRCEGTALRTREDCLHTSRKGNSQTHLTSSSAEQLPSGLHTYSAPEQDSVPEFCELGHSWIDSLAERDERKAYSCRNDIVVGR